MSVAPTSSASAPHGLSFGLDRVVEELDTVTALSRDTSTVTPILNASTNLHRAASHRYGPALGELLAARLLEDDTGRQLRRTGQG